MKGADKISYVINEIVKWQVRFQNQLPSPQGFVCSTIAKIKISSVSFDGGVQNYTAYTGDFKMVHLQIYKRLF